MVSGIIELKAGMTLREIPSGPKMTLRLHTVTAHQKKEILTCVLFASLFGII